jgi:transcriptional regulator NrdR family protein
MDCPFCQVQDSRVINTRSDAEASLVLRTRRCRNPLCRRQWRTQERPATAEELKRNGRRHRG